MRESGGFRDIRETNLELPDGVEELTIFALNLRARQIDFDEQMIKAIRDGWNMLFD